MEKFALEYFKSIWFVIPNQISQCIFLTNNGKGCCNLEVYLPRIFINPVLKLKI